MLVIILSPTIRFTLWRSSGGRFATDCSFFCEGCLGGEGGGGIKGLTDGVDRQSWYERMNEGDEKKLPVAKQVFGAVSALGHYFVPFVERIGRVCQANQGFLSKAKLADF